MANGCIIFSDFAEDSESRILEPRINVLFRVSRRQVEIAQTVLTANHRTTCRNWDKATFRRREIEVTCNHTSDATCLASILCKQISEFEKVKDAHRADSIEWLNPPTEL